MREGELADAASVPLEIQLCPSILVKNEMTFRGQKMVIRVRRFYELSSARVGAQAGAEPGSVIRALDIGITL